MVTVSSKRDIGQILRMGRLGKRRQTKVVKRRLTTIPKSNGRFDEQRHGIRAINDESSGFRCLESDPESLVVAVDAARSSNGQASARAGYGVFFPTTAHDLNSKGVVLASSPQISQYAELYATMQALETIHQLIIAGEALTHVIVKDGFVVSGEGTERVHLEVGVEWVSELERATGG
jgi:hypothetical protein